MRDPRFDDRCGHLNQDLFSKSFEFLKDMNEREMKEMQKDMKNTKDPMKKERLQKKLKRAVSSMHIHISTYIQHACIVETVLNGHPWDIGCYR